MDRNQWVQTCEWCGADNHRSQDYCRICNHKLDGVTVLACTCERCRKYRTRLDRRLAELKGGQS